MEPTPDRPQGTATPLADRPRRFRRSSDRQLGGVARGMADYVGVDPLFFRIGFVVLALASGVGIFAYLGAWLLIPDDRDDDDRSLALTGSVPALVAGFTILVLGSIALTAGFSLDLDVLIPLVMVGIGVWVLNQRRDPDTSSVAFTAPTMTGMAPAPPADPHVVPPPPSTPPPPASPPPPSPVVPAAYRPPTASTAAPEPATAATDATHDPATGPIEAIEDPTVELLEDVTVELAPAATAEPVTEPEEVAADSMGPPGPATPPAEARPTTGLFATTASTPGRGPGGPPITTTAAAMVIDTIGGPGGSGGPVAGPGPSGCTWAQPETGGYGGG
ncbi:MAG: PspC domain-containing protein, partial [Actinomycetota bacterium]